MSAFNQNIMLLVIRKNADSSRNKGDNLLRFATCSESIAGIIFSFLSGGSYPQSKNNIIAIPQDWVAQSANPNAEKGFRRLTTETKPHTMVYYKENLPVRKSWGTQNTM